jgi:phospholipid/cholesterol/gamma-HCH transport system permease protein
MQETRLSTTIPESLHKLTGTMEVTDDQAVCPVPLAENDGDVWAETAFYVIVLDGKEATFSLRSDWVLLHIAELESLLNEKFLAALDVETVHFRCGGLQQFDLSGAWLLYRLGERLRSLGRTIDITEFRDEHINFIEDVLDIEYVREIPLQREPLLLRLTEKTFLLLREISIGLAQRVDWWLQVFRAVVINLAHPTRIRWIATVRHIGDVGISAIGIVALMSFLIALVLGFQGQSQLVQFGAQIFTVDLVSLSVLREMGGLLTAILVAGRSGSAFAAEIGVMRLNEELDAMQTMGVDPTDALIVPRMIALLVCLPLLTFIAALAGLLGMFAIVNLMLDIPLALAVDRFLGLEPMRHFMVGMMKAPFFALVIGMIGTYRGYYVERSAGAVGRNTTAAVVESVFTVIIVDAVFSILFTELGW